MHRINEKNMKSLRNKLAIIFTVSMLLSSWVIWWLQVSYFPATLIAAYPFIPLTFFISGIVLIEILYRMDKSNPRRLVNIYMILKFTKILIAAVLAVVYIFMLHVSIKPFIIVFAIFYMIYLFFETYSIYSVEKQMKKTIK